MLTGTWYRRRQRSATRGHSRPAPGSSSAAPYPNPSNAAAHLPVRLSTPARVRLEIYDLAGQRIRTLLDADLSAGSHLLVWDGRDDGGAAVASGVYLTRLRGPAVALRGKVLLLR